MKSRGEALAAAATSMIGAPFRLHGRDPEFGVDCVGLVACSLESIGMHPVPPASYSIRNTSIIGLLGCAEASGLAPVQPPIETGDIVLVKPGPAQHHLLIADEAVGFIHAHAGLRQVVRMPAPLPWPVIAAWRINPEN